MQKRAWFDYESPVPSEQARLTYGFLVSAWSPLREEELGNLLGDPSAPNAELPDIDFSARRKVLYLPPFEEHPEFVPVLSMEYHLRSNPSEPKLRIMFMYIEDGDTKLHGLGFRLERGISPSRHDFYHIQLIRDFRFGWGPTTQCRSKFPDEQPAFPLPAESPISLLLYLIMSLYGRKECWDYLGGIFGLKEHFDQMDRRIAWSSS